MTTTYDPAAPSIVTPADPGWDQARRAWNLDVDQQPAAVAQALSAADVVDAVQYAGAHNLRVAAQGTGHNARPLGPLGDTVLIKTSAMRQITVDPDRMTARVEAGATWRDVSRAAGRHGLACLAGSSPSVGVTGYVLGGGMSFLGRAFGLAANNVEAFEAVTADGQAVRADAGHRPDLFWALRGGGGSFAVITAIEMRLFPVSELCAGLLFWPIEHAEPVLHAWQELTGRDLPDEFSTTVRLMRFPALPGVPEPLAGRAFAIIDAIYLGSQAKAGEILAPLRALEPMMDTVQMITAEELGTLHLDPDEPVAAVADGVGLNSLPAEAIDQLVGLAGPDADTPLAAVEVRQLGGQLGQARPGNGALAAFDAEYLLVGGGMVDGPASAAAMTSAIDEVKEAMVPWSTRQDYLNFAERPREDPARFWAPGVYDRLQRVKGAVDPDDRIRANHPIPPAISPLPPSV